MSCPSRLPLPSRRPSRRVSAGRLRLLLFVILFDMFFRSTDVLYPWADWLKEFNITQQGLPTRAKLAELRDKANGSYDLIFEEFQKSFASVPAFFNPFPKRIPSKS